MKLKKLYYTSLTVLALFTTGLPCHAQTNMQQNITLDRRNIELDSVVVSNRRYLRRNNNYDFSTRNVRSLVSITGEADVLRYISTLPGVSQGVEGGLGFFIRGSNSGSNRVELDGVPIYGSTHMFGLFSVIPMDAVEKAAFHSGHIPASSGDFAASLTQISTIMPDNERYKGGVSISPLMAGASINGPLFKNKLTFQIAARYSLLGLETGFLQSLFNKDEEDAMNNEFKPEVADVYAKLRYLLNKAHSLELSTYYSNDYLGYANEQTHLQENWGNTIVRAAWNWHADTHKQLKTMLYYNDFFTGQKQRNNREDDGAFKYAMQLRTALREFVLQSTLEHQDPLRKWSAGMQGKVQTISPAAQRNSTRMNPLNYTFNPDLQTALLALYGDYEYRFRKLTASAGYRGQAFRDGNRQWLWDNNLRLGLGVELSKSAGLEFSYDQMTQFRHVVEGLPMGWALDLMLPADQIHKPEKTNQYYAGGFLEHNSLTFSSGLYYKSMSNLTSYKNAINIFGVQNANWMDEVVSGNGTSYGWELRAERKGEDWNAALSYTLSKTDRQFKEINQGKTFPFKFDRRHILNVTGQLRTRKRAKNEQHLNMVLAYSSGHRITLPTDMYKGIEPPYWNTRKSGIVVPPREQKNAISRQLMSPVNAYTLKDYIRLDVSYNFLHIGKRAKNEFSIGIFNVLNRQNPYLIFYDADGWQQLSLIPIIPSIQWRWWI